MFKLTTMAPWPWYVKGTLEPWFADRNILHAMLQYLRSSSTKTALGLCWLQVWDIFADIRNFHMIGMMSSVRGFPPLNKY